ncbi:MAG: sensor histidine kinase [Lachnospiraceae bacterium]
MGKNRNKFLIEKWSKLSIKRKISAFTIFVFLIIMLSVLFDVWVVNFSFRDFRGILEVNAKSSRFMDAMIVESEQFEVYVKHPGADNKILLDEAIKESEAAIADLPLDYSSMSVKRYAKTWSIMNSYEQYSIKRDTVLGLEEDSQMYVTKLYSVYKIQEYLQEYAKNLVRLTLIDENEAYKRKAETIKIVPLLVFLAGCLLLGGIIILSRGMNYYMITPILKLVDASRQIASNNFHIDDVQTDNQDELGDLVNAFNKMKFATGQYIDSLEEKREVMDLLHKEEIAKIAAEKHLETANLELLKSQINPHFLFNTLNVISGAAKLEAAVTTRKMIQALSSIFRYNLKSPQNEVILYRELKVVVDYLYLQQMRFGERVSYSIDCEVDQNKIIVPTFTFQPLVENAVLHGISKNEAGGRVHIRIWTRQTRLFITISDTGIGILEHRLKKMKLAMELGNYAELGIGLGNIYRRIQSMYQSSNMEIYSREGIATVVKIEIPLKYIGGES